MKPPAGRKDFRWVYLSWLARAEGVSLLLLFFVAMPYRALTGDRTWVSSFGAYHGILFLMFAFTSWSFHHERGWSAKRLLISLFLSSVPFGSFYWERRVAKELDGGSA